MSRHTPGPWTAFIAGKDMPGAESHCVVAGEHMACIADVPISSHATTHGEPGASVVPKGQAIANARLIAAAPKMLEVLQKIDAHGYTNGADYDMVRDAIAAATGEPA